MTAIDPAGARPATLRDLDTAMQELWEHLRSAYWAASTIESKDRIHGAMDLVSDVIDDLIRADLDARSFELEEARDRVQLANKDLGKLQREIDGLIRAVGVAANVARAIGKAIDIAAKLL